MTPIATPSPEWLMDTDAQATPPVNAMLSGSVYYPACGIDGHPVQCLGGYSHSYIYVDYGLSAHAIEAELGKDGAFLGYQQVLGRLLDPHTLLGTYPWRPVDMNVTIDGDPNRYMEMRVDPYAYWTVFERSPDRSNNHGPERFSLLYLAADGVAMYQALYYSHGTSPFAVAIIQAGEGFGGNWTDFYDPGKAFARTVFNTPSGAPEYLLAGRRGRGVELPSLYCWPAYGNLVRYWRSTDLYRLALWKLGGRE